MFESALLGILQGIIEWLPVSSEGFVALARVHLFQSSLSVTDLVGYALFLHMGTFLAALIHFRRRVLELLKALFRYKNAEQEDRSILRFLILSSAVSGVFGFLLLWALEGIEQQISLAGKGATLLIGLLLLLTALIQFGKSSASEQRTASQLNLSDSLILGAAQGLAILPGISRSGFTISSLLLRGIQETHALVLSFLMSLPAVLGANILLNLERFALSLENFIGLAFSFLFGLLSIRLLLTIASKLDFSWFALVFGLLTIAAALI